MAHKIEELPPILEIGMQVRHRKTSKDSGTYRIYDVTPNGDGSVRLYGGHPDPNSYQSFRAILPDDLVMEDRKEILAALKRRRG